MKTITAVALLMLELSQPAHAQLWVNGIPLLIERQVLPGTAPLLADALVSQWRRQSSATTVQRQSTRGAIILGRQIDGWSQTLQLRPLQQSRSVEIVASSVQLRRLPHSVPSPPVSLPASARLESTVESSAGDGRTSFFGRCQRDVAGFLTELSAAAKRAHWQSTAAGQAAQRAAAVTWWLRGSETMAVRAWLGGNGCRFLLLHEQAARAAR